MAYNAKDFNNFCQSIGCLMTNCQIFSVGIYVVYYLVKAKRTKNAERLKGSGGTGKKKTIKTELGGNNYVVSS